MSMNDARPGDVYIDPTGKLWRVISIYHEPTVCAEEVEGTLYDPSVPVTLKQDWGAAQAIYSPVARASIQKQRQQGGTSAPMWEDWERIWGPRGSAP